MGTIVVGVDESECAAEALRWAVREGGRRGWSVTAALCWGYLDQHHGPGAEQAFDPEYSEERAREALDAIVEAAVGTDDGVDVARATINDLVPRGLLEFSVDADLLVVGARGLGGFRQLVLGSVSQQVLHHAVIPVAIVRSLPSLAPGERERIVVGIDGSETAQRALLWALDAARSCDAEIDAVHAWTIPYMGGLYVPALDPAGSDFERVAEDVLDRSLATVDTSGVTVTRTVVCASGGAAIVEAAAGASLVVVGSRGLGGFKGLLLGSVSNQVTHHAPCPVVVIPA